MVGHLLLAFRLDFHSVDHRARRGNRVLRYQRCRMGAKIRPSMNQELTRRCTGRLFHFRCVPKPPVSLVVRRHRSVVRFFANAVVRSHLHKPGGESCRVTSTTQTVVRTPTLTTGKRSTRLVAGQLRTSTVTLSICSAGLTWASFKTVKFGVTQVTWSSERQLPACRKLPLMSNVRWLLSVDGQYLAKGCNR